MKIFIYKPKKDLCNICKSFKHGSEQKYNEHIMRKEEARTSTITDKINKKFVFTMNVEVVSCAQGSEHRPCIIKRNFQFIISLSTTWKQIKLPVFMGRIRSWPFILYHYLSTIPFEINNEIIFYSDGCT